jgi:hypothetical protein
MTRESAKRANAAVTGLTDFGLTHASLLRLGNRKVEAYVNLKTYALTAAVRRLPPSRRFVYMASRAQRWIQTLDRLHPELSFRLLHGKLPGRRARSWSELPSTLMVHGPASKVLRLADGPGISSVHLTKVAGRKRLSSSKRSLTWYCVRALVAICVERVGFGMQTTEDRFVLVRALSFENAKNRLKQRWREYARPYLNSDGRMVSWILDKVVDVYDTSETDISAAGTEVYSKLGHRRMRRKYVWRPKP